MRAANACDEGALWEQDPAYFDDAGDPSLALQGDPFYNLSEVTCRVRDADGRFALTAGILADALDYARFNGAEGAVFYFSRSTELEMPIPPVMDVYGNRRDTAPIKVVGRAVEIGRFWFEHE